MDPNGYRALARLLKGGSGVTRKTCLEEAALGRAENLTGAVGLFGRDAGGQPITGFPCEGELDGERVLFEQFSREKVLLICGGGHVSRPVSTLGKLLGYRVLVADDRPEFAAPERFPDADETACADFTDLLRRYDWDAYPDTSVVIVTRGHAADTACLRQVVGRDLPYIGMIGSHKKNAAVFDVLRREGVTDAQLAAVHAPIGLPIGGQTPEEIAVSIAAELVQTRQGKGQAVFSEAMLDALLDEGSAGGIMATVVRKRGSAPRGPGARLLLLPSGESLGTIGGGLAEYQALQTMRGLLAAPRPMLTHIDMANGEAGKDGLICGGSVDVLFEVVT